MKMSHPTAPPTFTSAGFLTAMMVGIVLTNLSGPLKFKLSKPTIDLMGGVSLQLFLTMSLMSMDLMSLVDSASLLLLVVLAQGLIITFFAVYVIFRIMGRDYDAAVISGGFMGLGLGATPVAIANMDAITQKHGPSPKALLVVPLVGAFFIDLVASVRPGVGSSTCGCWPWHFPRPTGSRSP